MSIREDRVERVGPREARVYTGTYEPLSPELLEWFKTKFDIAVAHHDYIGMNQYGKYVFKLHGPNQQHRGYQVRNIVWGSVGADAVRSYAKSSTFMADTSSPVQSFYVSMSGWLATQPLVIVEDPVSAMKVTQQAGLHAVALLGVALTMDKVREIASLSRPVIFAYDKDATADAFKHVREYGPAFPKVSIKMLETDIKDMKSGDVWELFHT